MSRRIASAILALAVLLSSAACTSALQFSKDASAQIAEFLAGAPPAIDAYVSAGVIGAVEAEKWKAKLTALSSAYSPLDAKIQAVSRLGVIEAADILPAAQAFARALDAENVINFEPNQKVLDWYRAGVATLQVIAARLVARLKSKASGVAESYLDLRREREETGADLQRLRSLTPAAE
jgi:hypothetical protein